MRIRTRSGTRALRVSGYGSGRRGTGATPTAARAKVARAGYSLHCRFRFHAAAHARKIGSPGDGLPGGIRGCCSARKLDADRRGNASILVDSERSNNDTEHSRGREARSRPSRVRSDGGGFGAWGPDRAPCHGPCMRRICHPECRGRRRYRNARPQMALWFSWPRASSSTGAARITRITGSSRLRSERNQSSAASTWSSESSSTSS